MRKSTDLRTAFLDPDESVGTNYLQSMMDRQAEFQARLAGDPELRHRHVDSVTAEIIRNADCLAFEAMELKDHLPWKSWRRDYGRPLTENEREAAIEEAVDCWHFLLNLFWLLGVTDAREFTGRFFAKNALNHQRQDKGY